MKHYSRFKAYLCVRSELSKLFESSELRQDEQSFNQLIIQTLEQI